MTEAEHLDVYVDESGDLGFSARATTHFVVAYVIPERPARARADLAKCAKKLNLRHHGTTGGEFKHSHDSARVRDEVISQLCKIDFKAGVVAIKKTAVRDDLRNKKGILQNYLIANYLVTALMTLEPRDVAIKLDRSMSKDARENFDSYFRSKVSWKSFIQEKEEPRVQVFHVDSTSDRCLQIADYVAGACFLKFERSDNAEYNQLRNKILFKDGWGINQW